MTTESKPRLFTFKSAGWVILIASLASLGLITWAVGPALMRHFTRPPGDGVTIESYRFALEPSLVERDLIKPITLHRDMVPVMRDPQTMRGGDVDAYNEAQRGKFLVPGERVIGVVINDEARAYPINLLFVHEIIEDTLGGVPIAVTYNWPCDSVRVFEAPPDNLAVSGLLYNSNLLMYAKSAADPSGETHVPESLWCQLQARAVTGPDAAEGRTLKVVPAQLTEWGMWLDRHPDTTVVLKDPMFFKRYKLAEPTQYFLGDHLIAPVAPLPEVDPALLKEPVIAIRAGEAGRIYPLSLIQSKLGADGTWTDRLGETAFRFEGFSESTDTVQVIPEDPEASLEVIHGFRFAIGAMFPDLPFAE